MQGRNGSEPLRAVDTGEAADSGKPGLRGLSVSWLVIAPLMIAATLSHVVAHTFTRYSTGRAPPFFGYEFNVHTDIPFMLGMAGILLASAIWLLIAAVVAIYRLARGRRLASTLAWQFLALGLALGLPFVPRSAWDELLLRTVGPGKAAGDLLATAAGQGDVPRLQQLLAHGVAVDAENFAQPYAWSALSVAVLERKPEAVAFLLAHGADPNRKSGSGGVLLVRAVRSGNVAIVRDLVAHGADVCALEDQWKAPRRYVKVSARDVAREKGQADMLAVLPECPTRGDK